MKKKILFISVLVLILVGSGIYALRNESFVNRLFMIAYGIEKDAVSLSDSEIIETAKSFQIDSKYALCELDTNFYHFLKSTSKEDSVIVRHHLQPLQVMYFNKEGNMIAFYINCDAGGFPNINWNGNHNFDVFPPAGKHYTPLDTVVTFQKLENFLIPVKNYTPEYNQNADYYVCVFWSKLMGRQSKRLIKLIQQNVQLSQEATKVIFVNTDNFFCKDFKQK